MAEKLESGQSVESTASDKRNRDLIIKNLKELDISLDSELNDSVVALVLECEGKPETVQEEFIDAAVDLVCDAIVVKLCDRSHKVEALGKATAKAVFENPIDQALGPISTVFDQAQGTISTVMEKIKIAVETALKYNLSEKATKAYVAAMASAAAKQIKCKQKNQEFDHSRHHVINNGVRKILRKIADDFLEHHSELFEKWTFADICARGFIDMELEAYKYYNKPLSCEDDQFVQRTTVATPSGKTHTDQNAKKFGSMMFFLRILVFKYMAILFQALLDDQNISLDQNVTFNKMATDITEYVHQINSENAYVDRQALRWYQDEGGDMEKYRQVHQKVAEMFELLSHSREPPTAVRSLAKLWVQAFFFAYQHMHVEEVDEQQAMNEWIPHLIQDGLLPREYNLH